MASTWATTESNETVSFNNLQNAVDTGYFQALATIPASNKQITKADASSHVSIDTAFAPFAAKASNQLVVKSNLRPIFQFSSTFYYNFDSKGWFGWSSSSNACPNYSGASSVTVNWNGSLTNGTVVFIPNCTLDLGSAGFYVIVYAGVAYWLTFSYQYFDTTTNTCAYSVTSIGTCVSSTLLLDGLNSSAAYSLRRLRTAYLGAAINVRRSSDGATQDIGFVNNELDTASLLAFVGTGNGFVTTWYDQSGNGRNATQATSGEQPQIVDSGAVITMSCRPALRFDGNDILNTPSFMLGNTVVTVARRSTRFQPVVEGVNVGSLDRGLWGLGFNSIDYTTHLNYGINGGPLNATNADGFPMNVLQVVSQTVAKGLVATNASVWGIGGGSNGYVRLNGFISEMVAISSLLSTTDRQAIESNQMQYYCITSSTSYQAKYGSNLSTICSQSVQTVYIINTGTFSTGTTVYSDAALTIPLSGNIYISETVSGTIWNINSSTGVIGTSTGNIC
jgi:hypothetical protein